MDDQAGAEDDAYDYGADAVPDQQAVARAFADLDKLTLAAERGLAEQKRLEDQLDRVKKTNARMLEKDIPELLAAMRLDECTTSSGIEVKIKRDVRASLPGQDRIEARLGAFRWLVENGHGGVIKNSVAVTLDRGEDARADDLVVDLRARGFDVEQKKDVHNQTLCALARELLAAGKIIPTDKIHVFDQRVAKLSRK